MNEFNEVALRLPDPFRVLWRETVSSTNDELRELAEKGTTEGLVLICEEQSAGRGRRGAVWVSPKGEGLAFSVLLRPRVSKNFWYRLSLTAGLAVAEALEKWVPLAEIKWPNDVQVGGKKIAGILVEAGADFVIVGIGINVNPVDFPEELRATSLRLETGDVVERGEVLLAVVKRLAGFEERIADDFGDLLEGIRERCALSGKQVTLTVAGERRGGLVKGIGKGGELLVEMDGKVEALLQADEVRVREG
ncbi:MAG: biotin--[acetyl-CoA-carboxylase] ligase [Luteolibacter sp.]